MAFSTRILTAAINGVHQTEILKWKWTTMLNPDKKLVTWNLNTQQLAYISYTIQIHLYIKLYLTRQGIICPLQWIHVELWMKIRQLKLKAKRSNIIWPVYTLFGAEEFIRNQFPSQMDQTRHKSPRQLTMEAHTAQP